MVSPMHRTMTFRLSRMHVQRNTIAIMVEPVQGEGGVHPATMEFMQGLRKFCDENDMLLLIDEVQTGWCRTGAVMSYMNYGIKPDMLRCITRHYKR